MECPIIIDRIEQNRQTIRRLNDMRSVETKCSFKIHVGKQTILAHRDILMGSSRYFEAMLSHDTLERQKGEVKLEDVDYDCVKTCIDAIYGEEIKIHRDNFEDMLFVAQMIELDSISSAIEQALISDLRVENFIEILNTAKLFHCMKLQLTCERFAEKNFKTLLDLGILNNIDFDLIATLFRSEDVKVSQQEKLDFLIFWVKSDVTRYSTMMSLLEMIDLKQIPAGYRRYLIEEENLIKNDLQHSHKFISSIMDSIGVKTDKNSGQSILIFDQINPNLQLFDPVKNDFKNTGFKRIGINGHFSVAILNCQIYMLGHDRSVRSLKWNDKNAAWQTNQNMLDDHGHSPPVVPAAGFLYVIGGSEKCSSDTVERYSPQTNQWEMLQSKDNPITGAVLVTLGDFIYSIGGRIKKSVIKTTAKFDVFKEKWLSAPKMNEKREGASATVWKNSIIVAGGFQSGNALRSVEQYHTDVNQWTLMRSMKIPRGIFQMYSINETLFAVGGRNDESAKRSLEKYNNSKRMWESIVIPDTVTLVIYRTIQTENYLERPCE